MRRACLIEAQIFQTLVGLFQGNCTTPPQPRSVGFKTAHHCWVTVIN